jgi:hypothetical protein
MKRFFYDHGLPFSTKVAENIDSLLLRIKKKKASMIIIDGGVGEGKTTLGVHIADYVQGKYIKDAKGKLRWKNTGKDISFKTQYAIGGDQFQEKLQISYEKKLAVVIYDEAGDFNTRGALTAFNQRLNRIFQTYRAFKILVIIILPNFKVLDNNLFDLKVPRLLFNCYNRDEYQGNFRAYSLYRMHYVRAKMEKLVVKEYGYSQIAPNFRGHYLDLEPKRSKEMDELSTKGKLDIVSDNVLQSKGLISKKNMASKLCRTERWITAKLNKLKIKPQTTHKKRNYYDAAALEFLRNELSGK